MRVYTQFAISEQRIFEDIQNPRRIQGKKRNLQGHCRFEKDTAEEIQGSIRIDSKEQIV